MLSIKPAFATAVLLPVICAVAITGCGNDADQQARPGTGTEYVAMGDSYTAAPQLPPQTTKLTPSQCGQSAVNYPHLVARQIHPASFSDRSCTGATLADLSGAQKVSGTVNQPQGTDLGSATKLVTLTIGGNDIPLTELLSQCLQQASADRPCDAEVIASQAGETFQRSFKELADNLPKMFAAIDQRSPSARVFLLGYPQILAPGDAACVERTYFTPAAMTYVDRQILRLNAVLKRAAVAAGQYYVDTYGPSLGHDACESDRTRWVEPVKAAFGAYPFHPNPRGERAFAALVLKAIAIAKPR